MDVEKCDLKHYILTDAKGPKILTDTSLPSTDVAFKISIDNRREALLVDNGGAIGFVTIMNNNPISEFYIMGGGTVDMVFNKKQQKFNVTGDIYDFYTYAEMIKTPIIQMMPGRIRWILILI